MKKIVYLLCCLSLLAVPAQAKKKDKHKDLPPGLQKKVERGRELPPGWRKKLKRGERIDDSIYGHLETPPREVIVALPPPPPGVSFKKLEEKIIEIDDLNRRVLKILEIDKLPKPPLPPRLPLP